MTTIIKGTAVALVSKYTKFDHTNPEKTNAHEFSLLNNSVLDKNGNLNESWAKDGYVFVGRAKIEIELLPQKDVTASAVASLKAHKTKIIADAHAEATRIEQHIQSLLALTFEQ